VTQATAPAPSNNSIESGLAIRRIQEPGNHLRRQTMNRYENYKTSSRMALATAAIALTALVVGVLLIVPATMTTGSRELRSSGIPEAAAAADESNGRLRVDVIAVREPSVAAAQVRNIQAKRKQQG
jgi:H+/Cl- antiporter ClcA